MDSSESKSDSSDLSLLERSTMSEQSAAEYSSVYVTRPTRSLCTRLDVETDIKAKYAETSGTFSNRRVFRAVVSLLHHAHVLGERSRNDQLLAPLLTHIIPTYESVFLFHLCIKLSTVEYL